MGRTPPQILGKMQGFFFHYFGDKVDGAVKGWNVKNISIDRSRRHEDVKVCLEFWNQLDEYLRRNKSPLRW